MTGIIAVFLIPGKGSGSLEMSMDRAVCSLTRSRQDGWTPSPFTDVPKSTFPCLEEHD